MWPHIRAMYESITILKYNIFLETYHPKIVTSLLQIIEKFFLIFILFQTILDDSWVYYIWWKQTSISRVAGKYCIIYTGLKSKALLIYRVCLNARWPLGLLSPQCPMVILLTPDRNHLLRQTFTVFSYSFFGSFNIFTLFKNLHKCVVLLSYIGFW